MIICEKALPGGHNSLLNNLPPRFENLKADVLQRYQILNGSMAYDASQISRTAALVFDLPTVVVVLNERYRHWYQSQHGVAPGSLDHVLAFCALSNLSDSLFVVQDVRKEAFFSRDKSLTRAASIVFFAGAPLSDPDGKRFGTLCLIDEKPREFGADKLAVLGSFAELVSQDICLRSAGRYAVRDLIDLEEEKCFLFDLAMTDPLTKALNRRAFFRFAEREVLRSRRHGLDVSVLMIDIDHFKAVNDVYGHNAGDDVLKQLVGVVSDITRDEDLVGRLGGEEFALILPETDLEKAGILANRLREAVKRLSFPTEAGAFGISVSIGISVPEASDTDILPALARADKALYEAKRNGRDRVETSAPQDLGRLIGDADEWILRQAS